MNGILLKIKENIIFLFLLLGIFVFSTYSTKSIIDYIDGGKPVTQYVYYRSVEPTKGNFEIYKDITFKSDSIVYERVDITWQDVLRCDFYDGLGFRYFSYYESKAVLDVKDYTSIWTWQGETPSEPATCYLDGLVVINTKQGNRKELHISSKKFTVGAK